MMIVTFIVLLCSVSATAFNPFDGEKMETGYIDVGRGEIFYWFFEPRDGNKSAPVLLWLTGGPGCSSSTALFYENGPFQINDDAKTLRKNPYSWNENAYVIFADQPVGTGFSTKNRYVVNEEQISYDMKVFLEKFMTSPQHKDLVKNEFYISGESYAGHYVPAIAAYVARHSDIINLKGVAIGNGLVSPFYQYAEYANYAFENKKIGIVRKTLNNIGFYICQALIYLNLWQAASFECQINLMTIMGPSFYPFFNPYDVTKPCEHPPLCYDFGAVKLFLDNPDVRKLLNPKVSSYTDCRMDVHIFLLADWWFDFADDVRYLLDEKGIAVMVYSGDLDFVCNWRGGEAWVHKLDWLGKNEFNMEEYKSWSDTHKNWAESPAEYKVLDKLSFIRIYQAGHMVPMDKPEYSLEMINEFMFRGIN